MKKYAVIEKQLGETPLQALFRLRTRDHIPEDIPLAYAGRLDPMASGKLLVLIGEECKKQSSYHALDKEYCFELLVGFSSDTGDLLGIAERASSIPTIANADARKVAIDVTGTASLPYPVFSSKTVAGKPLFLWTLEKRLDEITVPTATTHIHTCAFLHSRTITARELLETTQKKIGAITPVTEPSKALGEDFRRVPILATWENLLTESPDEVFQILSFRTICSSGTYIRALAPHIATLLGTTGLAYSIHRTKIGRYHRLPLIGRGFWFPSY